jgi:hypothetical protein
MGRAKPVSLSSLKMMTGGPGWMLWVKGMLAADDNWEHGMLVAVWLGAFAWECLKGGVSLATFSSTRAFQP